MSPMIPKSQEGDPIPPPPVEKNKLKHHVFAYIRHCETRFQEGLDNGDDEIADPTKCTTFKEMKEWIVAAAIISNERLELAKLKSQHERMWRGEFQAFTRKQQHMLWKDFDHED